ncbi:MAG TPA: hypothetical protein VHP32_06765 [Ignavibacteria bacterium]|nr:hypothetical protein [Ignavibacteria bacterium]
MDDLRYELIPEGNVFYAKDLYDKINLIFETYPIELKESKSQIRLQKILNKFKKQLDKEHPWIEYQ